MTDATADSAPRHRVAPLLAIAGVIGLFAANFIHPVLRAAAPSTNAAITVVVLLLPWIAVGLSFRLQTRVQRFTVAALWLVFAVLMAPVALLKWFESRELQAKGDVDGGFRPVSTATFDGSRVIAYQTIGGATKALGFVVRQERPLGLGLLLVRDLYEEYQSKGGVVERIGEYTVRVHAGAKPNSKGDFTVKRFVWF